MAKQSFPVAVSDRVIEVLYLYAQPSLEINRISPTLLQMSGPHGTRILRAFAMSRFGRPSTKRFAGVISALFEDLIDVPPGNARYFTWGHEWSKVDVDYSPARLHVTLKSDTGKTFALEPIDISDQNVVPDTGRY